MTEPTRLFLLRHGEVEPRYHRKFGGKIDMDLSELGLKQAQILSNYLRRTHFDAVYASPMKRVQQTLAPHLPHLKKQAITMQDLREVDFGCWTGLGWEEVLAQYKVSAYDWLHQLEDAAIKGAECGKTFRARVEPCLRKILDQHPGQTVAVFCHGGVIRMIISILLDLTLRKTSLFEIDYASLTQVDYQPEKTEVQLLNFTPWRDLP
jgi:broad specificity phosphatase PhoE